jgi:hypothetical protein
MSKIATIAVSILLAFSAIAAGTSEQPVSKKQQARPAVQATVTAGEYDYRLERESCCGPQN